MKQNICLIGVIFLSLEYVTGIFNDEPKNVNVYTEKEYLHLPCVSPKHHYHQWHQDYQYVTGNQQKSIGNIPQVKGVEKSKLIIKVESFDNNTEVYCELGDTEKTIWQMFAAALNKIKSFFNFRTNDEANKIIIQVVKQTLNEKEEPPKPIYYNEKQNVSLRCPNYSRLTTDKKEYQLGIINTTSNTIETLRVNTLNRKFDKTHNGTILCCVYYNVIFQHITEVKRYVEKKTVLVYDDGKNNGATINNDGIRKDAIHNVYNDHVQNNNVGDVNVRNNKDWHNNDWYNNAWDNNVGINNDGMNNNGINNDETKNILKNTLQGSEITSNTQSTSSTNPSDHDTGNKTKTYVTATAAVGAVLIILLLVAFIWKKYFRKKPESNAVVLYADLEIIRQTATGTAAPHRPRPDPKEESPYAQIIGEMRPH